MRRQPAGRQRLLVILLATIGASLLLVVAVGSWGRPGDEHAYWLSGQRLLTGEPLYDPAATSITPYAYWYPPIVAQVMAPISALMPSGLFSAAWILLMLGCLWWLSGRDIVNALALCAFPPVAVEFASRNVHLFMAALLVLALRRWGGWFSVGAAIKLAPGLGLIYLALRGRWRAVAIALGFGAAMLAFSIALSPEAWQQFGEIMRARGPTDASAFVPVPYIARAIAGLALIVVATRIKPRWGEPVAVIGVVMALPTLWFTALSTLVAVVPLVLQPAATVPDDLPGVGMGHPS